MSDIDPKAAVEGLETILGTVDVLEIHMPFEVRSKFRDAITCIEKQAEEIERLREALKDIERQPIIAGALLMRDIARAALNETAPPEDPAR